MAQEYFLYRTDVGNTLTDRSDTPFTPAGNEGQIFIDFLIPETQALFLWRESGGTIIENTEENILAYQEDTAPPPSPDDGVFLGAFTGYTAATQSAITSSVVVEAFRTTQYNNVPTSFTDYEFDVTVLETEPDVVYHDDVFRDRFYVQNKGTYQISYQFTAEDEASSRLRVNDDYEVTGSTVNAPVNGGSLLTNNVITQLEKGDFVTLQVALSQTGKAIFAGSSVYVVKLSGAQGEKGDNGSTPYISGITNNWFIDGVDTGVTAEGQDGAPGAGSNINVYEDGSLVSGSPFNGINFSGFTVTPDGSNAVVRFGAASTKNKFQAVDSVGGQTMDDVTPNPLEWGQVDIQDTSVFTFTAGNSTITVLKTGLYELSYNINSGLGVANRTVTGVQFRRNGSVLAPTLTADYGRNSANNDTNNSLAPYLIQLNANDTLDVVSFRLGDQENNTTKAGASFVRINYLE